MSEIILATKRLRLEKIGVEHKKDLFRLLSNPKVHKYFPKALDEKVIYHENKICLSSVNFHTFLRMFSMGFCQSSFAPIDAG